MVQTRAEGWTVLVRLMVGLIVFFPERIQKLVFPEILGAGRFANIGIPYPEVMGPFVGVVEVTCGVLIILGFLTRLAAIPLVINHDCGDRLDQIADLGGPRSLDISCTEDRPLRVLEHGARGARRFPHASRIALPADRRRRPVVDRCRARPPRFGRSRRERLTTNERSL